MKKTLFSFFILSIIFFSSCRKKFDTVPSKGDFSVNIDTLLMDSVFTNIASRTYNFKIYNNSNKDIYIQKIFLEKGDQSFYRLNIDGTPGKVFENVMIHANDSIFVFVEVTADITQLPDPVYEEKLFIQDEEVTDYVLLTSFIKDADFYYPERFPNGSRDSLTLYTDPQTGETQKIAGFFLPDNTTFTADKPIVVYGHMAVPPGKTLSIEQGAHLYFHFNSGLIVWENASLKVNGVRGNEVIFEDDRMEPDFENKPGMWNYIWLREGSINNEINYAIIKNANIGLEVFPSGNNNPALIIKNTQIYNHSLVGIYGIAAKIKAENLVLNNFGINAVRLQLGGNYDFKHCTITNFGNGIRNEDKASFYASNFFDANEEQIRYVNDLEQLNISNSIIYGNSSIEYYIEKDDGAVFNYQIKNTLIKFDDPQHHFTGIAELDFTDTNHYQSILKNQYPEFEDYNKNKMAIGDTSPCINQGDINTALQVPLDILEKDRTLSPDLGAYQHITF